MAQPLQVAIIGAGIAGLTAAIALKDHPGIDVQLFERAAQLREIGASIALGPNGLRTLERLGVDEALDEAVAFRNKSGHPMIYRHYKTNEVVSVDSHNGSVEPRHRTARFHRAHLQQALLAHVETSRIHLSKAFRSVAWDASLGKLVITFADGALTTADVLLGADGIHSAVRAAFPSDDPDADTNAAPRWTGGVSFRSVFPLADVAHVPDLPDEATHFWGPAGRTLFLSPLGGDLFTVVASQQVDPEDPDSLYKDTLWNQEGNVDVLNRYYADWSAMARAVISAQSYTRMYPNAAGRPLKTWILGTGDGGCDGRVTLAGDAAHPHGGAFAAGGSLAIDDAWAFAAALQHVYPPAATNIPTAAELHRALRLYENTRKAHTDRVMRAVHEAGKQKRRRGQDQEETDEELRRRMKSRDDPFWIHEHDVQSAFLNAVAEEEGVGTEKQARL